MNRQISRMLPTRREVKKNKSRSQGRLSYLYTIQPAALAPATLYTDVDTLHIRLGSSHPNMGYQFDGLRSVGSRGKTTNPSESTEADPKTPIPPST